MVVVNKTFKWALVALFVIILIVAGIPALLTYLQLQIQQPSQPEQPTTPTEKYTGKLGVIVNNALIFNSTSPALSSGTVTIYDGNTKKYKGSESISSGLADFSSLPGFTSGDKLLIKVEAGDGVQWFTVTLPNEKTATVNGMDVRFDDTGTTYYWYITLEAYIPPSTLSLTFQDKSTHTAITNATGEYNFTAQGNTEPEFVLYIDNEQYGYGFPDGPVTDPVNDKTLKFYLILYTDSDDIGIMSSGWEEVRSVGSNHWYAKEITDPSILNSWYDSDNTKHTGELAETIQIDGSALANGESATLKIWFVAFLADDKVSKIGTSLINDEAISYPFWQITLKA